MELEITPPPDYIFHGHLFLSPFIKIISVLLLLYASTFTLEEKTADDFILFKLHTVLEYSIPLCLYTQRAFH